ncbi:MAG: hypothetical protein ACE368_07645 [Paracoccaceae bacterium]
MTYLPYGESGLSGWSVALSGSVLIHVGVVAGFALFLQGAVTVAPELPDRPDFTISLEQLDTDTLIGLVEDVGPTGGDDPDGLPEGVEQDPVSVPFEEALSFEGAPVAEAVTAPEEIELAALPPEPDEAVVPETLTPLDTPAADSDTADTLAPTTDSVEAIAAESIQVPADTVAPVAEVAAEIVAEQIPIASDPEPAPESADQFAPVVAPVLPDSPAAAVAAPVTPEAVSPSPQAAVPVEVPVLLPDGPALLPDGPVLTDGVGAAVPSADPVVASEPETASVVAPVVPPTVPEAGVLTSDSLAVGTAVNTAEAISTVLTPGPAAPAAQVEDADVQLALILPETAAPVAQVATAPSAAAAPAAPLDETEASPAVAQPAEVAAVAPQSQTDALEGREVSPAPRLDARDLALAELITRIRDAETDPCLLTIPRRSGENGIGLALLSSSDGAMVAFSETVLTEEDEGIVQTRTLVDERQCPALAFFQLNRDYPASRLGIRLETPTVVSGQSLTGVLRGIASRDFMLLLIDNNGVVQDLTRFASVNGDFARFEVPMTRVGPNRDTASILIALASRESLDPVRQRMGRLAEEVLSGLSDALSRNAALALASFDLR